MTAGNTYYQVPGIDFHEKLSSYCALNLVYQHVRTAGAEATTAGCGSELLSRKQSTQKARYCDGRAVDTSAFVVLIDDLMVGWCCIYILSRAAPAFRWTATTAVCLLAAAEFDEFSVLLVQNTKYTTS